MSKVIYVKASAPLRYEVRNLEEPLLQNLQDLVHGYIECVNPVMLPTPYVMIVDEEGALKENGHINFIGSFLYGGPIYGDIVFMADGINSEGEVDLVGLDCAMIDGLISYLHGCGIMIYMEGEKV